MSTFRAESLRHLLVRQDGKLPHGPYAKTIKSFILLLIDGQKLDGLSFQKFLLSASGDDGVRIDRAD